MFASNLALEPARPPVDGVRLVGPVHVAQRSDELPTIDQPYDPAGARTPRRGTPFFAWTDLTYLLHQHSRELALLRRRRAVSPTALTAG